VSPTRRRRRRRTRRRRTRTSRRRRWSGRRRWRREKGVHDTIKYNYVQKVMNENYLKNTVKINFNKFIGT
jgi:hypothetical protein